MLLLFEWQQPCRTSIMTPLPLPSPDDLSLYDSHFSVHSSAAAGQAYVDSTAGRTCLLQASGGTLPNATLASVWLLCDGEGSGQLDRLEFMLAVRALACRLIKRSHRLS